MAQMECSQPPPDDQACLRLVKNNHLVFLDQIQKLCANQTDSSPFHHQMVKQIQSLVQLQLLNVAQEALNCSLPRSVQHDLNQQHEPLLTHVSPEQYRPIPPSFSYNLPLDTSTPGVFLENIQMAQVYKRQIDEISKSLDTSATVQHDDQQQQPPRAPPRMMSPKKLKTGTVQNLNRTPYQKTSDTGGIGGTGGTPTRPMTNRQQTEVSVAAYRFATTRFPFAPFQAQFKLTVRDKAIIDDLVKHAKEKNVELKIAAYRHKQSNHEHVLLIFVADIGSFCFLNKDSNWPTTLANSEYTIKRPSTPPQLCLILPHVPLNTDWDDFMEDAKGQYPEVVNVIRLKNRNQRPVPTVKIEFASAIGRKQALDDKEMTIGYMKYKVVEFLAPVNVLICGNCCQLGHFQKNCPLKDLTVCKTCGATAADIKAHACSGLPKCVRCGEEHKSSDTKCPAVKTYRGALTRNMLQRQAVRSNDRTNDSPKEHFPMAFANAGPQMTTFKPIGPTESIIESVISKTLEHLLDEVKAQAEKTQKSIAELRDGMQSQALLTSGRIETLEKNFQTLETEIRKIYNSIEASGQAVNTNTNSNLSLDDQTSAPSLPKITRANSKPRKNKH